MDMYVRMYDKLKLTDGDNPTIGLILCSQTSEDMARYSMLKDNDRLFRKETKIGDRIWLCRRLPPQGGYREDC